MVHTRNLTLSEALEKEAKGPRGEYEHEFAHTHTHHGVLGDNVRMVKSVLNEESMSK